MTGRLGILSCANFARDVAAATAAEGGGDVALAAFPARCGRPPVTWDELGPLLPADCDEAVVLGNACVAAIGDAPPTLPPCRVLRSAQCFDLLAAPALVAASLADGAYLVTSTWLADWRARLQALGYSPEQAPGLFDEFAREIVLLDTGIDADAPARLAEFGAATGLPFRRVEVGLDHLQLRLARLLLERRLRQQQAEVAQSTRRHAAELANHVAAMDILARLAKAEGEAEAIAAIDELFHSLFAPGAVRYLRIEQEAAQATAPIPAARLEAMRRLQADYAWTDDTPGFLLRIAAGGDTLGVVAVEGLAFPEQRERYLNLALAVTGVCSLAIANARHRRRLVEMEKMASLAYVVAGVAHEINTPLGVVLTASSALQARARELAERFAARSMTRADLESYLGSATSGAALIRQNLDRIGRLVDAFREVAVDRSAPERKTFRLRACIDDVVRSFGDRMPADWIAVTVDVPPELAIVGTPADWSTIFANLIGNSLHHGFRGRDHGAIVVTAATTDDGRLRVSYRDDGAGMAPTTCARVFDPFFTTDMQHGMGLGMHLVYNLVAHRLGGMIACESTPGAGVCFRIDVPLHAAQETTP